MPVVGDVEKPMANESMVLHCVQDNLNRSTSCFAISRLPVYPKFRKDLDKSPGRDGEQRSPNLEEMHVDCRVSV